MPADLHITTLLHNSMGAFGRIVLCGIPLAGIVAWWIGPRYGLEAWSVAYALGLVPTLCAYPVCFRISSALFPELGWLLRRAGLLGSGVWERLAGYVKVWLQRPGQ